LESVIDATGLGRFTLLGISQSCAVSVAYVVRHPELLSGLVLYGGYVKGWRKRGNAREIATREAMATLMREAWGQDNSLFRQLFTTLFIRDASSEHTAWLNELQRRTVSPVNAWRLQNAFADIDVSDLLPLVRVPTLVLHAREDAVAPVEAGKAFASGIPDARFIELDSPNHILLEGEPAFAQFINHVHAFVDETAGSGPPPSIARREQITALAVEIISPLAAFDDVDPELFMNSVDPLLEIGLAHLQRMGGLVVSRGQSDLTAVFGGWNSSKRHAGEAARAALTLKKAVETASQGAARVRAAFDTGEAIVRTGSGSVGHRQTFNGSPIRVARRLVQALNQGIIAATARARAASDGAVRLETLDPSAYPSFGRDQLVYHLVGADETEESRSVPGGPSLSG